MKIDVKKIAIDNLKEALEFNGENADDITLINVAAARINRLN